MSRYLYKVTSDNKRLSVGRWGREWGGEGCGSSGSQNKGVLS